MIDVLIVTAKALKLISLGQSIIAKIHLHRAKQSIDLLKLEADLDAELAEADALLADAQANAETPPAGG